MHNYDGELSVIGWVVYIVVGLIFFGWATSFFVVVKQKTTKIIEVFGKYSGTKTAGLNFKPPFPLSFVAATVPLNIQEAAGSVGVKSIDNAFLEVPWKVQYRVLEDKVKEAHYELENPEGQMKSYVVNTVRSEASGMTMDQLFKSKDAFETAVSETLSETFQRYGYEIINVLVDDPQPSDDLKKAFDKVLASERDKEAASNRAEAKRIEMVGEAKAEGESLEIKAESFKKFRTKIAEGNSDAINKFLNGTTGLVSKDVLEFFEGVDTRDAIRDASKGPGTVVVVPVKQAGANTGELVAMVKALQEKMA